MQLLVYSSASMNLGLSSSFPISLQLFSSDFDLFGDFCLFVETSIELNSRGKKNK